MKFLGLFFTAFLIFSVNVFGQTTVFTYQVSLEDNSAPANGTYQMRFSLFNAQTGGNPVASTIEIQNVQVANGIFSVSLDFGAAAFDGSNRFLNVEVRRNSGENYVALSPREQIKSVPYSVRSATSGNADQLGGVSSSQFVTTSSNAFIKNSIETQVGNFNLEGEAGANAFHSNFGYFIGGSRVLSIPGLDNTFIGMNSGQNWTTGINNTFLGFQAGRDTTSGANNIFAGAFSGLANTNGFSNVFIGRNSGTANTSGNSNVFVGDSSGNANTTGNSNSTFGRLANVGSGGLSFATAIGSQTVVLTSNTIQLGRTSDRTNVSGRLNVLNGRTSFNERGNVNLYSNSGDLNLYMQGGNSGDGIVLKTETPSSGNSHFFISHFNGVTFDHRLVVKPDGRIEIRVLDTGGNVQLCRKSSTNAIATCSSSMRYKSNVNNFSNGLDIIKKLRPVSFNWTDGGMLDFGLVAEEVAEVEPLLTTQNADGKTEGVKYDRIGVVLVNAVNQQQDQIEVQAEENKGLKTKVESLENTVERQNHLIENQNKMIENLRLLICADKPGAEICRAKIEEKK